MTTGATSDTAMNGLSWSGPERFVTAVSGRAKRIDACNTRKFGGWRGGGFAALEGGLDCRYGARCPESPVLRTAYRRRGLARPIGKPRSGSIDPSVSRMTAVY
jgi:hypothetical protein